MERIISADSHVTILQRDYKNTGLPDESFDVVWACESIAHSPDQRDTLAEAYRLLKPGGRLVVRDVYLRRPPANEEERRLMEVWNDAWVMPPLPTTEQFLSFVSGAGFTSPPPRAPGGSPALASSASVGVPATARTGRRAPSGRLPPTATSRRG